MKSVFTLTLLAISLGALAQKPVKEKDTTKNYLLKEVQVNGQVKSIKKDTIPVGLRLGQPLIRIPQNIISISSSLLKMQGGLQLKDAARNASGVYFGYNSSPFDGSAAINIRGFESSTSLNGMSRRGNYGAVIDDEAIMESVDIIKGPAGFVASSGEPGGTVNITTKVPGAKMLRAEITGGSFGLFRTTVDAGTAVKEKGFALRFNTAFQSSNHFTYDMKIRKYVVAPVLQYNFSKHTYLLADYNLIRGESFNGSVITKLSDAAHFLKDARSNNYYAAYGLPDSYAQTQTARLFGTHAFSGSWKVTAQAAYITGPYSQWYLVSKNKTGVNFDENGKTTRITSHPEGIGRNFNSQFYFNGKVKTGSISHDLIFGADYNKSRDTVSSGYGIHDIAFDRNNPNHFVDPDLVKVTKRSVFLQNDASLKSLFAYNTVTFFNQLLLNFGARYTWYENHKIQTSTKVKDTEFNQKALSPRVALTYMFDPKTSVYALLDQSFVPQSGTDANLQPFEPQKGTNREVGLKKNWFDGRLQTSIDGFHTVKHNVLVKDYSNAGFYKMLGKIRSKGIEMDVLGNITDHLSVSANYSLIDAIILEDTDQENVGNKLPGTPQQIINTWLQYGFSIYKDARLSLSAGSVTEVKRTTYEKDVNLNDFSKFDAGIALETSKLTFRLIGDNLSNKRYAESGDAGIGYPYEGLNYFFIEGAPINFRLSATVKF